MTEPTVRPMSGRWRKNNFVLVFRRRPRPIVYVRDYPSTAENPTLYQLMQRIAFGEIARLAKGKKMEGDLPPAAVMVKKLLSGKRFGRTPRYPKWYRKLMAMLEALGYGEEVVEEVKKILT